MGWDLGEGEGETETDRRQGEGRGKRRMFRYMYEWVGNNTVHVPTILLSLPATTPASLCLCINPLGMNVHNEHGTMLS